MSEPVSTRFHLFPTLIKGTWQCRFGKRAHSPDCAQPGRLQASCAGAELLTVSGMFSKVQLPLENKSCLAFVHCRFEACSAKKKRHKSPGKRKIQYHNH